MSFVLAGHDGQAEEEGGGRGSCTPSAERREAHWLALQGEEEESGHWQSVYQYLNRPLHFQPGLVFLCPVHAVQPG